MDNSEDNDEIIAGTDPLLPDSDFDGLLDGNEAAEGADPLLVDTDGDGFDDGGGGHPSVPIQRSHPALRPRH